MALVELQYEERADGLLYPILDIDKDKLQQLGRFGKDRLEYLHSQKFELYHELLLTGKLTEHCENIEAQADEMYEKLFQKYLNDNKIPNGDDFFARLEAFKQAESLAKEYIFNNYIYI